MDMNMMIMEPKWSYDVFLCFRGPDTRCTFTANLYHALRNKRFKAFMYERELRSGDEISPTLLRAIEESRVSVVVLSQDFASSTWCLNELVAILECKRKKSQLVLPIFYDVDPSRVRHQRGTYGEAMAVHKSRFGEDAERVQIWSSALSQVANLTGWHFKIGHNEYEYEFIQKIVEWVTKTVPRYDVFLSFREKDTRYSFTGYLYNALGREGFKTFMKNEGSEEEGDQSSISPVAEIEKSRLSIIVLSQNYAYSPTSLDELVTILDFMKTKNQLVWPIFYKVEPSDIRHQRKSYGAAMTEHENKFGKDSEKVKTWRSALFDVANLKGWHLKFGYEYELVEKIVETAIKI